MGMGPRRGGGGIGNAPGASLSECLFFFDFPRTAMILGSWA